MHRSAMMWMVSRHKQHASNPQHERRHAFHSNMLYGTSIYETLLKTRCRNIYLSPNYTHSMHLHLFQTNFSMTRSIPNGRLLYISSCFRSILVWQEVYQTAGFFIYLVVSDQFLCTNVHNYKNCNLSLCLWLFSTYFCKTKYIYPKCTLSLYVWLFRTSSCEGDFILMVPHTLS